MYEASGISLLDKEKSRVDIDSADRDGKEVDKTEVDQLESTRAQLTQAKEENESLKTYFNQITRDYRSLQMRFLEASGHEPSKHLSVANIGCPRLEGVDDIISLNLGMASSSTDLKKEDKKGLLLTKKLDDEEGLTLGLDCKFEASKSGTTESKPNPSPNNSFEDDTRGTWSPNKVFKTMWSGGDDEVSQQNPVKRARVSIRARCDTPTMNDGCQWRKYGQKIAKGNPCPRAYYRCTAAPTCPVRKQVQRCAEDISILITTYEGTHNHPLPMSATAMASTTSAAAHMLLSGSSSCSSQLDNITADLQADINCLYDVSRTRPFYTTNTLASTSCPTITLDLTSNPPSPSSSILSLFSPVITRYPNGSLNFGKIPSMDSSDTLPFSSWRGNGSLNSFVPQLINKNKIPTDLQKATLSLPQSCLPDSISVASKAITADPSFQTALATSLKSIIGGDFGGS